MRGGKKGTPVDFTPESEAEIFDYLGLEYVEPPNRKDMSSIRLKERPAAAAAAAGGGAAAIANEPEVTVGKTKVVRRRKTQKKRPPTKKTIESLFARYIAEGPEELSKMTREEVVGMLKEANFRYHNTGEPALTDAQ
jgi:hypothetical protein